MTSKLLLGLTTAQSPQPNNAPPHDRIEAGGFVAISIDVDPREAESESRFLSWLEAQSLILSSYAARGDVLPVAMGAVFSSAAALATHVAGNADRFAGPWEKLSGKCQYDFHIHPTAAPCPGPDRASDTGARFLKARKQMRDARANRSTARSQALREMGAQLAMNAEAVKQITCKGGERTAAFAVLLSRNAVPEVLAWAAEQDDALRALDLRLKMIGPCPPFGFAALDP